MNRFGSSFVHNKSVTAFGKIGYLVYGNPFIGGFIRFLHFKKNLFPLECKNILDAGCGSGDYAFYLAKKFPSVNIIACDIDKKVVSECSIMLSLIKLKNIKFLQCNLLDLKTKNQYDLVYAIDVLEHIQKNCLALENMCRALKKGGYLYLHLPNKKKEVSFFSPQQFKEYNAFESKEHIGKSYSLEELAGLLKKRQLKIIKKGKTFGFWGALGWECNQLLKEKRIIYLNAILIPMFKLFGYIDTLFPIKKGNGMFILAQKIS